MRSIRHIKIELLVITKIILQSLHFKNEYKPNLPSSVCLPSFHSIFPRVPFTINVANLHVNNCVQRHGVGSAIM